MRGGSGTLERCTGHDKGMGRRWWGFGCTGRTPVSADWAKQRGLGQTCNALNLGVEFFFFFLLTKFRRYSLFSSRFAPSSQFQSSIATGVRIVCKQNLSCHGCCIMTNHISSSDVVLNRVFCSVSFRDLDSDLWSRVLWASIPARDPALPGPAWPGPARP